ncbi:MAG TPA: hypothetical protein VIJ25_05095 [Methylococcales bacterium]
MTQAANQASLYNRDFALWVEDVTAKLKARDLLAVIRSGKIKFSKY